MTNISIKTKQMKITMAVTNVRRHSGVRTFSNNLYCARSLSVKFKSKPSRKYCLEIAKQIAALKFQKFVISGELRMTKI